VGRRVELHTGSVLDSNMDHVIRLLPNQLGSKEFDHPLLDKADSYKLTEEQFKEATRQEQQLSLMWIVRRLVGRYIYNWPISEIWLDEMCSAALLGLCEIQDLTDKEGIMNKLQDTIEQSLNNHRSLIRASLSTNKRRSANNEDLEYVETTSLRNVAAEDMELCQAEIIDELSLADQTIILEGRYDHDD